MSKKGWQIKEAPYVSPEQAAYMHIHEPEIAEQWDQEAKKKGEPAVQPDKKKKDDDEDNKKSGWRF